MKQSDLSESRSQEYIQESDGLITVLNFHLLLSNFHPLLSNFLPELWLLVVRHDENQGWRVVKCDKMLGGKSEEWSKGCTCIYTSNTASTALYSIYSIHSNYSNTAVYSSLQHFYSIFTAIYSKYSNHSNCSKYSNCSIDRTVQHLQQSIVIYSLLMVNTRPKLQKKAANKGQKTSNIIKKWSVIIRIHWNCTQDHQDVARMKWTLQIWVQKSGKTKKKRS